MSPRDISAKERVALAARELREVARWLEDGVTEPRVAGLAAACKVCLEAIAALEKKL